MSEGGGPAARRAALAAMRIVRDGGYANLAVKQVLGPAGLSPRDAGFVTQLVYGTCRQLGTLDSIIEAAAGRPLSSLQPGVVDVLRLGAEQLLSMRVPAHAAVAASVDLAAQQIGRRVTGVVNAILRRVADKDWPGWLDTLAADLDGLAALAVRTCHPRWIAEAYGNVLDAGEVEAALEANNEIPVPVLVARPGLMTRDELLASGGEPTRWSQWGVVRPGDPAGASAVRDGRAGVQDEGSQLVAMVLAAVDAPAGPWLDMCAGPGGKTALLTGLARAGGEAVVAADLHPHRAALVAQALGAYFRPGPAPVMVADGLRPAWGRSFARVLVDAPCSGLGSLRRRPEARWRKAESDLDDLVELQKHLLRGACASAVPGGVVAYVTCSPHLRETAGVVQAVAAGAGAEILDAPAWLPGVPGARSGGDTRFIQLWPHRHNTDAMFCALLRVGAR